MEINDDYETQKFANEVENPLARIVENVNSKEITNFSTNPIPESEDYLLKMGDWQEVKLPNGRTVFVNKVWRDDFFKGTVGENNKTK